MQCLLHVLLLHSLLVWVNTTNHMRWCSLELVRDRWFGSFVPTGPVIAEFWAVYKILTLSASGSFDPIGLPEGPCACRDAQQGVWVYCWFHCPVVCFSFFQIETCLILNFFFFVYVVVTLICLQTTLLNMNTAKFVLWSSQSCNRRKRNFWFSRDVCKTIFTYVIRFNQQPHVGFCNEISLIACRFRASLTAN